MLLKNANIYCEDGIFRRGDVEVLDDRIAALHLDGIADSEENPQNSGAVHIPMPAHTTSLDEATLDLSGMYLIPGLIDLHFHGAMGADVCDGDAEGLAEIARYEAAHGITTICPATLTLPEEELCRVLSVISRYRNKQAQTWSRGTRSTCINTCRSTCINPAIRISDTKTAYQHTRTGITDCPPDLAVTEASIAGINMEGPFISPAKCGAQNAVFIRRPDIEMARRFLAASNGLVKFIGLAPEETPDFGTFIRELLPDVHVSLAHTNADYATACEAIRAGADHAVHLFNAMSGLDHRNPGAAAAILNSGRPACLGESTLFEASAATRDSALFEPSAAPRDSAPFTAELITDGIHVHPAMVRLAFQMLGADSIILISDSLRAAGMPDGEYQLGGQRIVKRGPRCLLAGGLPGQEVLAGSVSNLMDCLRTAVLEMGIPLENAIRAATRNPARKLGIFEYCGSVTVGKKADLCVLDRSLRLQKVIKEGKIITSL